jgi:HD-GYP domain-containing protein (c-di-GMP phosphodiesterase class II)
MAPASRRHRFGATSKNRLSARGRTVTHHTDHTGINRERIHAAQQMLTAFFVLVKTAGVYETSNDSYRGQLTRFHNLLLNYLEDHHGCTVKVVADRLFVDEQFINIDSDDSIGVRQMLQRWDELGIGGFIFGDSIVPEHVTVLINLISTFKPAKGEPCELINRKLADEGADSIIFQPKEVPQQDELIEIEDRQRIRREARQTFFRAIATVKEVVSAATQNEKISVARTRRVVHTIIDQLSEDESALMELASIKDFDEYTYAHSVNVSIYALTLGFRLGLSRPELSELGFAALFHDIGKIKLPHELVTKPDRFDEFDWNQMHRHPILGALTIAQSLKLDAHMARAMAAAYEHHIHPDNTGYPTIRESRPTNLYSRIISVSDNFDALTSGRVYIKESIPADEVLRKLMYQMSVKFDAFILKLFVGIIGIYPVGSLVLLSNNSIAIVTRTNPEDLNLPELRIIADNNGLMNPPQWCNLADPACRGIEILRILDPKEYDIDLTGYILTD